MSDVFEDSNDDADVEVNDEFLDVDGEVDVEPEPEVDEADHRDLDARRRLEGLLDERRLRDELDDFGDY